ncbi:hypothetical protein BV20DRAFT_960827 [Pilatotrama ljubarskyi]|nr:hypothetical protein BV20DRAFT_960827 [Pilatotrama ljubarskyi]
MRLSLLPPPTHSSPPSSWCPLTDPSSCAPKMVKNRSCRHCRNKKILCQPCLGRVACQHCVKKDIKCVYPPPAPKGGSRGTRRTACDRCRKQHIGCERVKGAAIPTCLTCALKGHSCSLSRPGAAAESEGATLEAMAEEEDPGPEATTSSEGATSEGTGATSQQVADGDQSVPQVAGAEVAANTPQPSLVVDTVPPAQVELNDSGPDSANTAATSPGGYWRVVLNSPSPGGSDSSHWPADEDPE